MKKYTQTPAYPATAKRFEYIAGCDSEVTEDYLGLTKLEAFTMAAMQGLCKSAGIELIQHGCLTQSQVDGIADAAQWIASATLSELSKRQQP